MINKLKITNFRSVGDKVSIPLDKLNFFVGVNGSGKSNVLRALSFVREAVRIGLPGAVTNSNGIESIRRHSAGRPHNVCIELEMTINDHDARYGFELTGDRSEEYRVKMEWARVTTAGETTEFKVADGQFTGPENIRPNIHKQSIALTTLGGDARIRPLWDFVANTMMYSINPYFLRKPQPFSAETPMSAQGENWVSVLHTQCKEPWINELTAGLGKLTGDIDGIKVTKAASLLVLQFQHSVTGENAKKWFDAERESDGTLRVAGILTALLQKPWLPLMGIEELEQAVHPGALPLLYDYLSEAATRSQVIVTTHSPILLDHINLEDAKVFIVDRNAGATVVRPLSPNHKEALKKPFGMARPGSHVEVSKSG